MLDVALLASCAAAIFVLAAVAQAVSGFGSAMLAIPLLVLVVDPATAVVAATGVSLVIAGLAWRRERAHVVVPVARRLVVGGLVGMPAGLAVLLLVDERLLSLGIGALILVTVVLMALRVRLAPGIRTQWGAGLTSGALLTSTGMNGPPLVLSLAGSGAPARGVRATLQAVFTVQDFAALALFLIAGVVGPDALVVIAAGCLGVRLGWVIGDRIFHALSEEMFRRVVLVGLTIAALTCLTQGSLH